MGKTKCKFKVPETRCVRPPDWVERLSEYERKRLVELGYLTENGEFVSEKEEAE